MRFMISIQVNIVFLAVMMILLLIVYLFIFRLLIVLIISISIYSKIQMINVFVCISIPQFSTFNRFLKMLDSIGQNQSQSL